MKLEQLLEGVPYTLVQGSLELDIEDIIYDSRKAAPGRLFVCIVGTQRDSHDYAAQCAAEGVTALVVQHDIDLSAVPGVTVLKVESSRYALALMSGNLFGNPSRRMTMIGVTGTKGKTTTTHMIKSVLEAAGRKVGMIGTNGIYFLGHHKETANTTPESYELQKTFRQFLDAGCDTALMEVSSQGLMMDRVAGIHFHVGVFTNLSPDHIGPGEHKTFEEYRSWKGKLFQRCDIGVVNIDDANTEALLEGAVRTLRAAGCPDMNILVKYVPGTFELSLGAQFFAEYTDVDAVIALGCVIQGDTRHFDFICQGVTQGITQLQIQWNMPIAFGVLTVGDMQQALDRCGGRHGNKGDEAAATAINMVKLQIDMEAASPDHEPDRRNIN